VSDGLRECLTCAEKPGSPYLCSACIYNRAFVAKLLERIAVLERFVDIAESVPVTDRPSQELRYARQDLRDGGNRLRRLNELQPRTRSAP
jgi:hypothetical protein